MSLIDLFSIAFLNLWRRKLRAFLTVLGMVIGVTSILVMVSLGIGIKESTIESFAGTGSLTIVQVSAWSYSENGMASQTKMLDKKAVEKFRQMKGVTNVMPIMNCWGVYLKSGSYITDITIMGITPEDAEAFGVKLEEGRLPTDKRGGKYEIVFSPNTLQYFHTANNYRPAVDRDGNPKVKLSNRFQMTFDYRNVYQEQTFGLETENDSGDNRQPGKMYSVVPVGITSSDNNEFSWYSLMDVNALERLMKENREYTGNSDVGKSYEEVYIKCASIDDVSAVTEAVKAMGYGTYSLQDAVQMAQESTQRVQYLLGAIGGVSLLVAAIGITNTMMMSIFERTKEIGIIKVLGCRMDNIVELFLAEAAFIGLIGGAMGLGLSYGVSAVLNKLLAGSMKSVIPGSLAIGAVIFSIIVALLAGLYPALRAMKLSPLAAIRNE